MKKAQIGTKELVYLIIVIAVVAIVVGALIKFDVVGLTDLIFPSGKIEEKVTTDVESSIYFDKDGACKPFQGLYRLNKDKELEILYKSWTNIDKSVLDDKEFEALKYFKGVRDELVDFKDNKMFMDFQGERYQIYLWENGLATRFSDGSSYFYVLNYSGHDLSQKDVVTYQPYIEAYNSQNERIEDFVDDGNLKLAFENGLKNSKIYFDGENREVSISWSSKYNVTFLHFIYTNSEIAKLDRTSFPYAIDSKNNFYFLDDLKNLDSTEFILTDIKKQMILACENEK
jgi:hypothetical protein